MESVSFITLGCKVNTYESNALAKEAKERGYEVVEPFEKADIYIINTCSVTHIADTKSKKMIRRAKSVNGNSIVCVMGCFPQANKDDAIQVEEADIIIGNGNKSKVFEYIDEFKKNKERITKILPIRRIDQYDLQEASEFDHARAFVKIEDGCSNFCSYCIIPFARGKVRSKNKDLVIEEIKNIVSLGYHEVVLSGIQLGQYESDPNYHLTELCKDLIQIDGLDRIRISSIEINDVTDGLIELMKESKVMANHMHLPLQSGSDKILKLMNRHYDSNKFYEKVKKLRAVRPDISITCDVIVGFPEETDDDFNQTVEFIKKVNFSQLHVFPFSRRKGTRAYDMQDTKEEIKKERVNKLLSLSKQLEFDYYNKFIGKEVEMIVETKAENNYMQGHTTNYLKVYLKEDFSKLKKNVLVHIDSYEIDHLVGHIVENN